MKFRYEAHDRFAIASVGEIDAESDVVAGELLREKGLFVTQIIPAEGNLKTILKHDDLPGANGINNAENERGPVQAPDPAPDLERELFGDEGGLRQDDDFGLLGKKLDISPAIVPDIKKTLDVKSPNPNSTWDQNLARDLNSLGDVLKTMHAWRVAYNEHEADPTKPCPPVTFGGKTWEVIEAALPQAKQDIVTDIIKRAVQSK